MANKKAKKGKKMNKGKKGGKPSTTKKTPRQPVPVPRMMSSQTTKKQARMGHVHATCSMTDPFCSHARGAQRPDGGPPSIPYQIRGLVSIVGWASSGATRFVFVPGVIFNYAGPSAAIVGPPTGFTNGAAWVSVLGGTDIIHSAKEVRIVSFGVVLRCPLSAVNASGQMIVATQPLPAVSESYISGTMNQSELQVHAIAAGTEVSWISKPQGPSAHLFRPLTQFTSTMTDFDWTSLSVDITGSYTGAAGATLMIAEYVMNVEFTLNPTSTGMANLAKAPSAPNKVAVAAADTLRTQTPSFIQGGIQAVASKVEAYATSALDEIMSDGLAFLFTAL
jgi:hypothetical protein